MRNRINPLDKEHGTSTKRRICEPVDMDEKVEKQGQASLKRLVNLAKKEKLTKEEPTSQKGLGKLRNSSELLVRV